MSESLLELIQSPNLLAENAETLASDMKNFPYFHIGAMLYVRSLFPQHGAEANKHIFSVRDLARFKKYLTDPNSYLESIDIQQFAQQKAEEKTELSEENLIDRFLKNEPSFLQALRSVQKAKEPEEETFVANFSETKTEYESELCTETLADILVAQGNFDKACEIYEALAAREPDRKVYFETQIKRIKEK